jgi:hypothetical protein
MAMPVFRFITGSRSQEGTANQIAAMLGRVRSEAIGAQKPIGVAFFIDGQTNHAAMAEVEFASCPTFSAAYAAGPPNSPGYKQGDYVKVFNPGFGTQTPPVFYYQYVNSKPSTNATPQPSNNSQTDSPGFWLWVGGPPLELRTDTDIESLPAGIGVQTMCNYLIDSNSGLRATDSYLNVGVIMFGADGTLTVLPYGISQAGKLGLAASFTQRYPSSKGVFAYWDTNGNPIAGSSLGVLSQVGLVVFDREKFIGQNFTDADPLYDNATGSAVKSAFVNEAGEETWLDQNAQPLLINRFNGTLVRQD